MRDFRLMRDVLITISKTDVPMRFHDFLWTTERRAMAQELERLADDGVIESTLEFMDGECLHGAVSGLSESGKAFVRLIENDEVWAIVVKTLEAASVDVPYPLLKDVCEEIVRRYVASFIPDI